MTTTEPLEAGKTAASTRAWAEAYELLTEAASAEKLGPADVQLHAEAAWWAGRLDEAIELREQAYAGFMQMGERQRAGLVAISLWMDYGLKGKMSLSSGWYQTAERLLGADPETPEFGRLAVAQARMTMEMGELDSALEHASRAVQIAQRFEDPSTYAMGTLLRGQVLVRRGDVQEGLAALDEATVAANAGGLEPLAVGVIYCSAISQCQNVGDLRRACEITEAAKRWCDQQTVSGFPGLCRIHNAEAMRFRGEWQEAEQEARRACDELAGFNIYVAAAGFYEIGEVRRRFGDFAAAEEAYARADELGHEPQPGLALLRLAQGKTDAAVAAMRRTFSDEGADPLARARALPALVEIAIAAGDLEWAEQGATKLEDVAARYAVSGAPQALPTAASAARGAVLLARGDFEGALAALRRAARGWQEIGDPYETARVRMLLGVAYAGLGDRDGAAAEVRAARASFERLGAVLEVQRAAEVLGEAAARRTFMFTDIVDSTKLLETLGERKWKKILEKHDDLLRTQIAASGGEVIKQTGDGFFAAFGAACAAVDAAVNIQRALDEYDGYAPDVRIGVHTAGGFAIDGGDYGGRGVHTAARIGAVANAREIVASVETVADPVPYALSPPRSVELKGLSEPVELVSVDWS